MDDATFWWANWGRGLLLVVVTAIMHTVGLGLIGEYVVAGLRRLLGQRHRMSLFVVVVAVSIVLITVLHAFEAAVWALAFVVLGALPDWKTSMLYSLEAMTAYGHIGKELTEEWMMLGGIEALNGMMLLGLTTATLITIVQRSWPLQHRE